MTHKFSDVSKKGFTLIELLIVIAIIGILASLLLLNLNTARQKGRDAKRISDVSQLATAIELFADAKPGTGVPDKTADLVSDFISRDPKDPTTDEVYGYGRSTADSDAKYQVWAELERDPGAALDSDADVDGSTYTFGTQPTKGTDGTKEVCTGAAADCVYDLGIK